MKYHIEEVQVPRGSDSPLDLGDGRRIVHVVSQVPAEDGGLDTLHVLVENDGSADDPRGYGGSGPGANMAAPQPAGPISDEDAEMAEQADGGNPEDPEGEQYPANPVPGEDAAPVEPAEPAAEAEPAWTSESSDYEPGFERTDPEGETGEETGDAPAEETAQASEDGGQAGPVADSEPVDDGQPSSNQEQRQGRPGWRRERRGRVTETEAGGTEDTRDE